MSVSGGNPPAGGGTFYESTTADAPLVADLIDGDRWWNYDTGRLYTWIGIWVEI